METATQSSPPTPDDFQITAADIAVFEERQRRLESLKPKLSFALSAAVIALIGLLQTDWKSVVSDGFLSASTYIAADRSPRKASADLYPGHLSSPPRPFRLSVAR
jgi:hypothetical protein